MKTELFRTSPDNQGNTQIVLNVKNVKDENHLAAVLTAIAGWKPVDFDRTSDPFLVARATMGKTHISVWQRVNGGVSYTAMGVDVLETCAGLPLFPADEAAELSAPVAVAEPA